MVEDHLAKRTQVCSYDRAGKGASDPASSPVQHRGRSDLHAFLRVDQPHLPGRPLLRRPGGVPVRQTHPDQVAGFVAINPGPPYRTWLRRARTIQTEAEVQAFALPFLQGDNAEGINLTTSESMLTDPLPADLPYAVMFDASCEDLPPPRQNPKTCARYVHLMAATSRSWPRSARAAGSSGPKGAATFSR